MANKTIQGAVVNVKKQYSNKNEEDYYTIEVIDLDEQKRYHTYASDSNRNWPRWRSIVEQQDRFHWLEATVKNADSGLLNADSGSVASFDSQEDFVRWLEAQGKLV